MKKISFLLLIFLSSCSTTERFLPGFVPDFIKKYFQQEAPLYAELPDFVQDSSVSVLWEQDISGEIDDEYSFLKIYKFQEEIYIPTNEKEIIIISSESGEVIKSLKIELDIFSGIVVDENLIYFGSKQDTVTAVDYGNNKTLWQRVMSSEVMSISEVYNNIIYVMTNDSKISAIDVSTGKFIWINSQVPSELSIRGSSTPIIYEDKVYVGFEDGKIISYDAFNGDIIWEVQVPATKTETIIDRLNDIDGSVLIDDGVLYAISYQGSAVAIDSLNGQILWKKEASSINSLASNFENIIYISNDGVLVSLDKYTGRVKWKQNKFFKRLIGSPIMFNDFIIVGDVENYLHIFNADTGSISGRIKIKKKIQSFYHEFDSLYILDKDFSLKKINISKTN
tara:strand:+ start:7 stop:1188 length:1182 start_codon:yes stop_codon:yes gene_type:complete